MLNDQELSRGYIQQAITRNYKVELYKEYNTYHVRRFSYFIDGQRTVTESWLIFHDVTRARQAYKRQLELAKS